MKKNILFTGSTGFIGTNLIKRIERDYNVFLLLSPRHARENNPGNTLIFSDDVEELISFIRRHNIKGIVHLASLYLSQHKPEQCKDLVLSNVYLGTALLEAASKTGVKWFLNTGTYWQNYDCDRTEYNPVNLYAATKQAFVDMARYYTETTPIRFATLKICDTFGPGDPRPKIMALFNRISRNGETLAMSPGEQHLNLLYIDDVVAGFAQLMALLASDKPLKSEYKLSARQTLSLKELAAVFEQVSQRKLNIEWGGREYRPREVMTPWKAGEILPGWEPATDLRSAIAAFIKSDRA